MLYWDLDGVLRILGSYVLGYEPENWHDTYNGKTIIELVNEHPELCATCPESEYLSVVNEKLSNIIILTNQLDDWIPFTEIWLRRHIKIPYDVVYTKSGEHKLKYLKKHDILIEDFPNFFSYDNIALITRNYNKKLVVPLRISNTIEFNNFITKYMR
jgi:hypothetical protein